MPRRIEEPAHGRPEWLQFVPRGGLVMLGAIVALLGALAARELGLAAVQLLLIAAGLLAAGVAVMRSLHHGGTLTGTILTGGVLIRLLVLLGIIVVLLLAGIVLVEPTERDTALTAFFPRQEPPVVQQRVLPSGILEPVRSVNFQWGAPGGGLPDGHPAPFPWMFYTFTVCLVLGFVLTAAVGAALLLKWRLRNQYVEDEPGPAEVQTSSALLLVLAAVVAFLAYRAFAGDWDSGRMFACVAALVALVGAMFILLPLVWRKVLASLLIVVHFGGICTAITAIAPPGGPAPWVASKMWLIFYRPYLQFTYMNNAYHFYSPEPGPASLMWAYLRYQGGEVKQVRLPSREHSPVPLYYQRMLSITESISQTQLYPGDMGAKIKARTVFNTVGLVEIPLHPEYNEMSQYREPNDNSRRLTMAYVRHLARAYPKLNDKPIEAIKVYRVQHNIINAGMLASGQEVSDPRLYLPVYYGTFSPEGKLLDADSHFLYWIVPILQDPKAPNDPRYRDFQAIHANDWSVLRRVPQP